MKKSSKNMLNVDNQNELYMDAVLRHYDVETRKPDRTYRSFIDVVKDIRKEWENMTETQQKALIKAVFECQ